MDIYMPEKLDAEAVRDHALEAYRVNAFQYLVKPVA